MSRKKFTLDTPCKYGHVGRYPHNRRCIECNRHAAKEFGKLLHVQEAKRAYRRSPRYRAKQLIDKYGLTPAAYGALMERQRGLCAICKSPPRGRIKNALCVDHDHTTKRVRGLLCDNCNRGVGLLGDDAQTLRAAAEYLDATK